MKKSLLALAALTAFAGAASAQSSVTLSGIMKAGLASTKYSNAGGSGLALGDGSSRFILSGREDLGGGVFAVFQVDTRFRIDDNGGAPTSSPLAGGNTFVGLQGGFGQIRVGKLDTHYCLGSDSHGSRATALTASSCALLGYVNGAGAGQAIANASRSQNIIRYDMPTLFGISGGVAYSTSFQGSEGALTADDGKATAINLGYTLGPIRLAASKWNATNEAKTAGQRGATLTASVDVGFMTVGATFDRSSIKPNPGNRAERDVWSVPVTVKLGNGTLIGTYSKASNVKLAGASQANTGATLMSVGYEHSLSKRTSLGVSYAQLDNKAGAAYGLYTQAALVGHTANATGQDARQLYFGVRHTF